MFNFFAIPTNQLVIPIKGKKGGVALCLFLIVVGLTILTYRPMQVSGFAVKPALDIVSHFNGKGHGVAPDSVRLYIGIITSFDRFGERSIWREAYSHFKIPKGDTVTVEFVLGLPMDPKGNDTGVMKMMLWEQERFKDVKILDMGENMNGGKSYEYFADLGRRYPGDNLQDRPWDYVMKADDDSFINIPQLLERLRAVTPKDDLYMGRGTDTFHMGAGYLLSWDLVAWLRDNPTIYEQFNGGAEDKTISQTLRAGGKGLNFVKLGEQVMDHPQMPHTSWTRPLGEDVIVVHQLKTLWLKGDTIDYFLGREEK